jgi:plastocyanin
MGAFRIRAMQHRLFSVGLAVALAVGLAACGSDAADGTDSDAVAPVGDGGLFAAVTIENFTFTADPVPAGTTVTVANDDTTTHSVVSDDLELFTTDTDLAAGTSGEFLAPEEPGSYPFHCGIHSTMKGTLVVE